MNEKSAINVENLPARLTINPAGDLLGFQPYEMGILLKAKLLKPLGSPAQNGHKYFAKTDILRLTLDRDWLDKATRIVAKAVQNRNKAKAAALNSANGNGEA